MDRVIQVMLNIEKLRDTHKTLTQSIGQYNASLNNEVTQEHLRTTPTVISDFPPVQKTFDLAFYKHAIWFSVLAFFTVYINFISLTKLVAAIRGIKTGRQTIYTMTIKTIDNDKTVNRTHQLVYNTLAVFYNRLTVITLVLNFFVAVDVKHRFIEHFVAESVMCYVTVSL